MFFVFLLLLINELKKNKLKILEKKKLIKKLPLPKASTNDIDFRKRISMGSGTNVIMN